MYNSGFSDRPPLKTLSLKIPSFFKSSQIILPTINNSNELANYSNKIERKPSNCYASTTNIQHKNAETKSLKNKEKIKKLDYKLSGWTETDLEKDIKLFRRIVELEKHRLCLRNKSL